MATVLRGLPDGVATETRRVGTCASVSILPMPGDDHPLFHPRYTRSNAYDHEWVFENQMGPERVVVDRVAHRVLSIEPGMRVLDLGCGRR